MKHILERHHPNFWNGTGKTRQTFFPQSMSIDDVVGAIAEVLKQNRERVGEIGTGIGSMTGVVNGRRYQLGLNIGRIGQFFPLD